MDDGTQETFDPGNVMVVGHEACIMIDWQGANNYAKPTATPSATA
jgi:hypothetical protein